MMGSQRQWGAELHWKSGALGDWVLYCERLSLRLEQRNTAIRHVVVLFSLWLLCEDGRGRPVRVL